MSGKTAKAIRRSLGVDFVNPGRGYGRILNLDQKADYRDAKRRWYALPSTKRSHP